tara:strand:- start:383 stop:487 length:105 start_codon:yes stop_codon:yes gene_type:complete
VLAQLLQHPLALAVKRKEEEGEGERSGKEGENKK